ncbi:winged helix-turn-helix transcriptional regulator [Acidianus manzaensis]|uniref:Transcriptional regulator n=1 Tax=Acidianus manzaensis TaxID=282676 RepID=A0A1W6JYB8_9CREN|nr:helix-turn-helix domain-containing protein [Acidianus manzaensis]ARM75258.1 transcriptional regulator [Acidianus manzaensis]
MAQNKDEQVICPIVEAINAVGTEARLLVLRYLFDGDKGFNELLRLTKLSSKTLASTLKYLEEKKIIQRNIISTRPFKVSYSLTEKGKDLKPVFDDLRKWGEKWMDTLLD